MWVTWWKSWTFISHAPEICLQALSTGLLLLGNSTLQIRVLLVDFVCNTVSYTSLLVNFFFLHISSTSHCNISHVAYYVHGSTQHAIFFCTTPHVLKQHQKLLEKVFVYRCITIYAIVKMKPMSIYIYSMLQVDVMHVFPFQCI